MGRKKRETLAEVAAKYGCTKFVEHTYLEAYEEHLAPLRGETVNLLEVGVATGESLRLWLDYFKKGWVVGLDSGPFKAFEHERLSTYVADQQDPAVATLFRPESFDVIIDDAGHVPEHQRACFHSLWPALKPGGLYFVEDIVHPAEIAPWSHQPGFKVWANFRTADGAYRGDDILVLVRKPR